MPKRYSEEERQKICQEHEVSNVKAKTFCKEKGIGLKSLYRWKHKLKSGGKNKINFLHLGRAPSKALNYIEIMLPHGIGIKIALPAKDISKLIKELL